MLKRHLMMTALLGTFAMGSTAVMADMHEGGHKDGDHKGKMMSRVDTNGDGVVSKAEFLAKHEEMFSRMDTDNDGNLTKAEMDAAKAKMKAKWEKVKERRMQMQQDAAE